MARRIEIELTSDRGDGTWTWRAAGAKQPKGVLDGTLLPSGASTGDVLRADAEFEIDGITVTAIHAPQGRERSEPERIELLGSGRRDDEPLVTSQLSPRTGRDRDRDRRDRRPRGDGPEGPRDRERGRGPRPDRPAGDRDRDRDRSRGPRTDGPRGDRPEGDRSRGPRVERERRPRQPAPPPLPERPKPKRLRPGRVHLNAVLGEVDPAERPIADEVRKGGIPAVRQAIEAENTKRAEAGEPPINATELLAVAEKLLPRLRAAEWRDRAEAALADAEVLDLRDLRSVVVAADSGARDDESRALAAQLRERLEQRVESEHANWLEDLELALGAGRVVRALRLSSRPPKAGTILAPELRVRLVEQSNAALTAEVGADRWAAVLDAIAYSPVRSDVVPGAVPETPGEELLAAVRKYASRVPKVAAAFGVTAPDAPARSRPGRGAPNRLGRGPERPERRAGQVPVPARPVGANTIGAPASDAPADSEPAVIAADSDTTAGAVPTDTAPAAPADTETATTETAAPETAAPETATTETAAPEAIDDAEADVEASPTVDIAAETGEVADAETPAVEPEPAPATDALPDEATPLEAGDTSLSGEPAGDEPGAPEAAAGSDDPAEEPDA